MLTRMRTQAASVYQGVVYTRLVSNEQAFSGDRKHHHGSYLLSIQFYHLLASDISHRIRVWSVQDLRFKLSDWRIARSRGICSEHDFLTIASISPCRGQLEALMEVKRNRWKEHLNTSAQSMLLRAKSNSWSRENEGHVSDPTFLKTSKCNTSDPLCKGSISSSAASRRGFGTLGAGRWEPVFLENQSFSPNFTTRSFAVVTVIAA